MTGLGGFSANGAGAHGSLPIDLRTFFGRATVYWSSHSMATLSSDTPPSQPIEGRLHPFAFSSEIGTDALGRFAGASPIAAGQIVLSNGDGALEGLLQSSVSDGAKVTVYVGRTVQDAYGRQTVWPFANFGVVLVTTAEQWVSEQRDPVLHLRDSASVKLNRPAQPNLFGGSGGLNGSAEVAGLTKPLCYGVCFNIRPIQIDPVLLAFMIHPGPIKSMDAVRDRGVRLSHQDDFESYDDLAAADVQPGFYSTALTDGCFRVGAGDSSSVITADVHGAAEGKVVSFFSDHSSWTDGTGFANRVSGAYVETTAAILYRLMTDWGVVRPDDIETTSFGVTDRDQTAQVGIFLPAGDSSSLITVIDAMARGIGAWFGAETYGRLQLSRLEAPDASARRTLNASQIISMHQIDLPYRVPPYLWQVTYARAFSVQTNIELLPATTKHDRGIANRQWQLASAENEEVRSASQARVGLVEAFFADLEDAAAEARRLSELYSLGRGLYEIVLPMLGLRYDRGQTVMVTFDLAGFRSGRPMRIVGRSVDFSARRTTLLVFG